MTKKYIKLKKKKKKKKRSMHRLHIEDDIWKWYVPGQRKNFIVFAPTGKRYEVDLRNYIRQTTDSPESYQGYRGDNGLDGMITDMAYTITPADVKEYIIKNLQKQDASWTLCRG